MRPGRVFVVGSYMNAHFLHVAKLPREGQSLAALAHTQEHGGKGLNLALALHQLGLDVAMMLRVGCDAAGGAIVRELRQRGLSTRHVLKADAPSGYGVGLIAEGGRNMLVMHGGANDTLAASDIERAAKTIAGADWVVGQFEAPDAALIAAFGLARQHGRETCLNPSPWRPIAPELLARCTHLILNESEAEAFLCQSGLAGAPAAHWADVLTRTAAMAAARGCRVIITLAERGCVVLDPAGPVVVAEPFAIRLVDATGAGDAFAAGFIAASVADHVDPLRFANACGAFVAARPGVLEALPTRADIATFMARAQDAP